MRVMVIEPTANGTALTLADIPEPALGPAPIRIQVRAASVNRADLAQRAGRTDRRPARQGRRSSRGWTPRVRCWRSVRVSRASGLAIG